MKRLWLRSDAIRCRRWTIVFTPFNRRFRISLDPLCIVAYSGMGSADCLMLMETSQQSRSSRAIPLPGSACLHAREGSGYFHIDIAELRTAEGKLHMFVAIDRTSKFAIVRLEKRATSMAARAFLEALIEAVPYRIHTILTDNGIQFAPLPKNRNGMTARYIGHPFGNLCRDHEIKHRLTKPKHPWTNGPLLSDCSQSLARQRVERMFLGVCKQTPASQRNRTIKDATVKRFHYEDHVQLRRRLSHFVDAYNFARRLKTFRGLTPYEFICKCWTSEPESFTLQPRHQMLGSNT